MEILEVWAKFRFILAFGNFLDSGVYSLKWFCVSELKWDYDFRLGKQDFVGIEQT